MGSEYLFHPEQTLSRAQFTASAMAAADLDVMKEASLTGFADDEAMATWAKPFVSSALRSGVLRLSAGELWQEVEWVGRQIDQAVAQWNQEGQIRP